MTQTATVAVAGGDPQALGLAVALARAGRAVVLVEDDAHDVARASALLARGGAPVGIVVSADPAAAAGAGVVVQSGGGGWLARLAALADPDALLATLGPVDPGAIAATLADPARYVALDCASPPPTQDLVEVIAAPGSDLRTIRRASELVGALGAEAVTVPCFVGAAVLARIEDVAEALVFAGSTPWEVDAALEAVGFTPGPCAAQDLRGLDRAYARHRREDAANNRHQPLPVLDRMVPEGRLGRKGGVGWYRYPGGGGRVIDPLVEDLAREEAHFAGFTPHPVPEATILARMRAALIDQAQALVSRGVDLTVFHRIAALATGTPPDRFARFIRQDPPCP